MKFITKSLVLMICVAFLSVCNSFSLLNNSTVQSQRRSPYSSPNVQIKESEIRCASAYTKIPDELISAYSQQSKNSENINSLPNSSDFLRNDVEFYGFTYSVFDADNSRNGEAECSENGENRENIVFVNRDINNIIRLFISALIFNEREVIKIQSNITENNYDQSKNNELKLCVNVQCGLSDSKEKLESFNFVNSADIKYAKIYSDSTLTIQTLDHLRKIIDESNDARKFTDSELVQMLTQARIIAYNKADNSKE
jgi:hypothetical protein